MPELPEPKVKPHPWKGKSLPDPPQSLSPSVPQSLFSYADLQVRSNFTFLTGASHPEELVCQAAALGHRAAAITDTNSLAGIVRGHLAAKEAGIPFVVGCGLVLGSDGAPRPGGPPEQVGHGRPERRSDEGESSLWAPIHG